MVLLRLERLVALSLASRGFLSAEDRRLGRAYFHNE
jgi:hypothetical protein